jgi:hypothetical protein
MGNKMGKGKGIADGKPIEVSMGSRMGKNKTRQRGLSLSSR